MNETLDRIYIFLRENRKYNFELQTRTYQGMIGPLPADQVICILYDIAGTQSQPNIDKLAGFFKHIHNNHSQLNTFAGFLKAIDKEKGQNLEYKTLFNNLRAWEGWGDKTAALFCKTIFHFHNGEYTKVSGIWKDIPTTITKDDELFLPVDAVIVSIFNKISTSHGVAAKPQWNFTNINKLLHDKYTGSEIEVWDDLWFWGFISQKGGEKRTHKWNPHKYWVLKDSDKSPEVIAEIERLVAEFISIIEAG